ncbi:hypothetical protein HDV01_002690 [Terramyces sp. JEL0728]|nr:hypothetical protein HDV01_002690 [Terramyces sp. JEL0728]
MEFQDLDLKIVLAKNELETLKSRLKELQAQAIQTEQDIQSKRAEISSLRKVKRRQMESLANIKRKNIDGHESKESLFIKLKEFRMGMKKVKMNSFGIELEYGPEIIWRNNKEVCNIPAERTDSQSNDRHIQASCTINDSENAKNPEDQQSANGSKLCLKSYKNNILNYELEEPSDNDWKSKENMSIVNGYSERNFSGAESDLEEFIQLDELQDRVDFDAKASDSNLFFIDTDRGECIKENGNVQIDFHSSPAHDAESDDWELKLQKYQCDGINIVSDDVEIHSSDSSRVDSPENIATPENNSATLKETILEKLQGYKSPKRQMLLKHKLADNDFLEPGLASHSQQEPPESLSTDAALSDKENLLKKLLMKKKLEKNTVPEPEICFRSLISKIPTFTNNNLNYCTICGQYSLISSYQIAAHRKLSIPTCKLCSTIINSRPIISVIPGFNTYQKKRIVSLLLDPLNGFLLDECVVNYYGEGSSAERKAQFNQEILPEWKRYLN